MGLRLLNKRELSAFQAMTGHAQVISINLVRRTMMKHLVLIAILLLANCCAYCDGIILDRPMDSEKDLSGVYSRNSELSKIVKLDDGSCVVEFTVPDDPNVEPKSNVVFQLSKKQVSGKKVAFSGEARVLSAVETAKWGGGEFSMWFPYETGHEGYGYDHCHIGTKASGWKKLSKVVDVPEYATHLLFTIGISNARGIVQFRNIKVESGDTLITFPQAANMDFRDEIAGDGKGGWHDGGSAYDARSFPIQNRVFGNVPFRIIDPAKNQGKAVTVFACQKLPGGVNEAVAEVNTSGKYIYLLHATAWDQEENTPIGSVVLENEKGDAAVLDVIFGKDAMEWYRAKAGENAWIGAQFPAGGSLGAVYVSRFAIPEGFGVIKKVMLKHEPAATAMWLVLAANISDNRYEQPEQRGLVMKEDDVWKPLPQSVVQAAKAGSAIDIGALFPNEPTGSHGRVIINKDGHFAFEDNPAKTVRFMAIGTGRDFDKYFGVPAECSTKEQITAYAEQMRRNGYNMIRWWPQARTSKQKAFENDPEREDLQDWLYAELKRNGVYIILSVNDWTAGYDYCNVWSDPRKKAYSIFLDPKHRESWLHWVQVQLTHINPYTKTRLLDDPGVVGIDCNNELEFYFMRADDRYAPLWRQYLQEKYKTFEVLKAAWVKDADGLTNFEDINTFIPLGRQMAGPMQQDKAAFVTSQERGLLDWQKAELKKICFKGYVTNYCMGRSMRHVGIRRSADFVMQNGYHAHPFGSSGPEKGGKNAQDSSVGSALNIIRTFLASRMYGKPYDVSEHGHVFWNKYRYEQGLVMGAYSALNDLDVLTGFFMQVTTNENCALTPFEIRHDPISRASELLTALVYRREDAKTPNCSFRIKMNPEQAVANGEVTESINATQMKLGLLAKTSVDLTNDPVKDGEVLFNRVGGSKTAVRRADTNIIDSPNSGFDFDSVLTQLKQRNVIAASNRTSEKDGIYESATGEIYMDTKKHFLQVNTERTQGIAAEAGTTVNLPALEVIGSNRRSNISLSAIDGDKPITQADRLLLIVATNVLNTGMSFVDANQVERINKGTAPLLLQTGAFAVAVKSPKVEGMKLYALALDGSRIAEIPFVVKDGKAQITLDTAKYPTVYFELSRK